MVTKLYCHLMMDPRKAAYILSSVSLNFQINVQFLLLQTFFIQKGVSKVTWFSLQNGRHMSCDSSLLVFNL